MSQGWRRLLVVASVVGCLSLAGCDETTLKEVFGDKAATAPASPAALPSRPGSTADPIRMASFNIQVFGTSKLGKPAVMDVLAQVVRRFDVVAVQELRSSDQTVIAEFLRLINADGSRYDATVGPRLGRTSSKEQYVYLFDTTRLELLSGSVWTVPNPNDRLHRPPLVATFRVRGLPSDAAFTFTLADIHTDPDETDTELDALADVVTEIRRSGPEDDVILLGDLNADPRHFGRLGRLPNITWAIEGMPTNTRGTETYDNLVFDARATAEYSGQSGVLDLQQEFSLTREQALEVSDHYPIWATFRTTEQRGGTLAADELPLRR